MKRFADLLTSTDQLDKSKQGKGHWKPELASNSEEAVCLPPSLTAAWEPQPLELMSLRNNVVLMMKEIDYSRPKQQGREYRGDAEEDDRARREDTQVGPPSLLSTSRSARPRAERFLYIGMAQVKILDSRRKVAVGYIDMGCSRKAPYTKGLVWNLKKTM